MEEKINYSFIIPHKNCPDLLRRCVGSIPQRDDIQIIVVDDNSDEGKKPNLDRKDVEVILLDAEYSKGAGRARNVGLDHAKGKWLLFADADDYYTEGLIKVLDEHKESDIDILFFSAKTNYKNSSHYNLSKLKDVDTIKYKIRVPWNKMFNTAFVKRYNISFEEILKGNDIQFSYMTSFLSTKIDFEHRELYMYEYNSTGITNKKRDVPTWLCSITNYYKINKFYDFIDHPEWKCSPLFPIRLLVKKASFPIMLKVLYKLLLNINSLKNEIMRYPNLAKEYQTNALK